MHGLVLVACAEDVLLQRLEVFFATHLRLHGLQGHLQVEVVVASEATQRMEIASAHARSHRLMLA